MCARARNNAVDVVILRFLLGAAFATVVSLSAARARSLSGSGAAAAAILGTIAVTAGWSWGILLVVFFTLTAALTAYQSARKRELTREIVKKSDARDAAQVLANGGAFALAALAWIATGSGIWLAAAAGSIAAAAADSWATETGIALGGRPRAILTGKPAAPGTSGAVTATGSLGGVAGAAAMAATVLIIGWSRQIAAAAFFAGAAGMIIDSILGATVQARRFCTGCDTETEQPLHHCGRATEMIRGVRWLDNDMVNVLATLSGALIAALIVGARE